MAENYQLRQICLRHIDEKKALCRFLEKHGLRYEDNVDVAFGVFREEDVLIGCGCAAGPLLKCFAVDEDLRGQNLLGSLVSALVYDRFAGGIYDLFLITKAKNETVFSACGFYAIARTNTLVMLENRADGPKRYAVSFLSPEDNGKTAGAIVMNCNPFTLGHRRLIEYASSQCQVLHIFVVEENRSMFPSDVRYRLVCEGTSDLSNVRVHLSGPYILSSITFPTYFLKKGEDAAALQSELDIALFAEQIAPVLHITKRFAGEEPLDPVTAKYNAAMKRLLPQYGIEFCEIPRLQEGGMVISASRVRALLNEPARKAEMLSLLPACTQRYLTEEWMDGK